jgi:hypothetical protein
MSRKVERKEQKADKVVKINDKEFLVWLFKVQAKTTKYMNPLEPKQEIEIVHPEETVAIIKSKNGTKKFKGTAYKENGDVDNKAMAEETAIRKAYEQYQKSIIKRNTKTIEFVQHLLSDIRIHRLMKAQERSIAQIRKAKQPKTIFVIDGKEKVFESPEKAKRVKAFEDSVQKKVRIKFLEVDNTRNKKGGKK